MYMYIHIHVYIYIYIYIYIYNNILQCRPLYLISSLEGIKSCLVQNRNPLQTSDTSIEWYIGFK